MSEDRENHEKQLPPLQVVEVEVRFQFVLRDDNINEFGENDYDFAENVFDDLGGWSSLSNVDIDIEKRVMYPLYNIPRGWDKDCFIYGPDGDVKLKDAIAADREWQDEAARIAEFMARQVPLFPEDGKKSP